MKHKRLTVLFCLACLFLFAGILTACRQSVLTLDKIYEEGYNCEVVFDLVGGKSGKDDREREELHQYVQSGSPIIKPGTDKNGYSGETPVRAGYTFGGFYTGTKEGETVTYDKKWDFSKDKVTGNLTLYAYWRENYTLNIHYGENLNNILEGETDTYQYDKVASIEVPQDEDGVAQQVTPAIAGKTVIAYFEDEATAKTALAEHAATGADEQRIQFPMTPTDKFSEENKVWDVYANVLDGSFTVVRTESQFQFYDGSNIYLMTDIDYEQAQVSFPDYYTGKFYGNGHTVHDFTVTRAAAVRNDSYLGLFNRLTATSFLGDVTFTNFVLDVSTSGFSAGFFNYIGALAGYAAAGAKLKNVVLSGEVVYSFVEQTSGELVYGEDIGFAEDGFKKEGYTCTVPWNPKTAS